MAACRFCQSEVADDEVRAHEDGAHPAEVIAELRAGKPAE